MNARTDGVGLGSFWGLVCVATALAQEAPPAARVIEREPHHNLIEAVRPELDAAGQVVMVTNRYVELATGLNRFDSDAGAWVPAVAGFELTTSGYFVARHTQHQVILAPDLLTEGAVDCFTPDGLRLRSTPYGIGVLDAASGRSVLLAGLQSCQGELVSPTEVVFPRAFDTLQASVRFTTGLATWEQDVVLEEAITPDLLAKLGIDPATAQVFVMTEFFAPPVPEVATHTLLTRQGTPVSDVQLGFGQMFIGTGQALAPAAIDPVPVFKDWSRIENRQFLIESVAYADLAPLLAGLPAPAEARARGLLDRVKRTAALPKRTPPVREARANGPRFEKGQVVVAASAVRSASTRRYAVARPGVVLDYVMLNSGVTNYTFRGDTTYLVTGQVNLSGTTILEGGTVVKFTNAASAYLNVTGAGATVQCRTGPYRPAIFTGQDDLSVGESTSSSTNGLSGFYGGPCYLKFDTYSSGYAANLSQLRLLHSYGGINLFGGTGHTISHAQFVNCQSALTPYYTGFNLRNVLVQGGTNVFANSPSCTGRCEQVTFHGVRNLYSYTNSPPGLYLTNSLVVAVTNNVSYPGTGNQTLASDAGVFQTVGAGAHYLAANDYRQCGTTAINATLAADLKTLTTYPPRLRTNAFALDMVLGPTARRDNAGAPDLGYHYEPLDYCWTGLILGATNATVTLLLTNGVAVGIYGSAGTTLLQDARFLSEGAPTNLNHLVRCEVVQEQPTDGGGVTRSLINVSDKFTQLPAVRLRFTELSLLAGSVARSLLFDPDTYFQIGALALQDCLINGGALSLSLYPYGGETRLMTLALTNNLLRRMNFSLDQDTEPDQPRLVVHARDNLFFGGSVHVADYTGTGTWMARDNLFDQTTNLASWQNVLNSNNGYTASTPLPGSSGGDILNLAPDYLTGALGSGYYPTTGTNLARLINAGSRTATAAGLYHDTTATAQTKETTGTVDIGFHYVACTNGTTVPVDSDSDGLADGYEDANGDGVGTNDTWNWTTNCTTSNAFGYNDRQSLETTGNFLVNDPQQDYATEQNTQWQPKVVALGDTVIMGYWDSNQGAYGLGAYAAGPSLVRMVAYSVSLDGGRTFSDMGVPPLPAAGEPGDAGDPVLAVDRDSGVVYYAATSERSSGAYKGVPLWKSMNKGASFTRYTTVHEEITGSDYPWIAVDDRPDTGQHDIYIVIGGHYTNSVYTNTAFLQWLTVSTDGGTNWSDPKLVGDTNSNMPQMVIDPDHTAILAWTSQVPNSNSLQICSVTGRGGTVGPVHSICGLVTTGSPLQLPRDNTTTDANDWFTAFNYSAWAVNPDTNRASHLYVTYADTGTATNDLADVFFVHSTDGGTNWSSPMQVNLDNTTNYQWMPTISVKPDGNQLFIGWLDRRNDPTNALTARQKSRPGE